MSFINRADFQKEATFGSGKRGKFHLNTVGIKDTELSDACLRIRIIHQDFGRQEDFLSRDDQGIWNIHCTLGKDAQRSIKHCAYEKLDEQIGEYENIDRV